VCATAPGAAQAASTAPQVALVLSYFGILFVCLWNGRLRWLGLPLAAAVALWPRPPAPLAWIASDGGDAAVAFHGQEVALKPGVRSYATQLWAQRRRLALPEELGSARGRGTDGEPTTCAAGARGAHQTRGCRDPPAH